MTEVYLNDIQSYKRRRKNHSDYSYGGWYIIINIESGMSYVGKSIEIVERLRQHVSIKDARLFIDKEINRLGKESFRYFIIEEYKNRGVNFFNRKIETSVEKILISKFDTRYPNGYNQI